jgi:hypothetical protein
MPPVELCCVAEILGTLGLNAYEVIRPVGFEVFEL